ncbi:MAG: hypothetical protein MUF30_12540 [Burkholderiales bacterium]|jgi:hypothetical protein|nr:hypothetical protein [Burkholderiales bacterium]
MKRVLVSALVGLVLVASAATVQADEAAVGIKVRRQGGITFVTGGLGDDERTRFESIAARYPVQLIFRAGDALLDRKGVKVRVLDARGESVVEWTADGPLFYVNVPGGRWTFEGTLDGRTLAQTRDLTGRRYLVLDFHFDAPAPGGDAAAPAPADR